MKIGFIGLGIMGEAMAANLVKKNGDPVYVSDINKAQVEKLVREGAVGCADNLEAARQADVIITMVPRSEHVRAVYTEILPLLGKGRICIDMSTIDPSVSLECAAMVKATGAQWADAPVVKSKPAAISGTLGILVGCDEPLYPVIEPILRMMGCNVIRMGACGMGITMKICHNTLVAQIQNGVNETLGLAQKLGISIDDFATAVSYGGAGNFYLESQKENLKAQNWTTAFSLENEHKDLGIAERLAQQAGLDMPGLATCKAVYDRGMAAGLGRQDFRATYKIVNGIGD